MLRWARPVRAPSRVVRWAVSAHAVPASGNPTIVPEEPASDEIAETATSSTTCAMHSTGPARIDSRSSEGCQRTLRIIDPPAVSATTGAFMFPQFRRPKAVLFESATHPPPAAAIVEAGRARSRRRNRIRGQKPLVRTGFLTRHAVSEIATRRQFASAADTSHSRGAGDICARVSHLRAMLQLRAHGRNASTFILAPATAYRPVPRNAPHAPGTRRSRGRNFVPYPQSPPLQISRGRLRTPGKKLFP